MPSTCPMQNPLWSSIHHLHPAWRTLLALLSLALALPISAAPRPHLLIIYTDDHGYGDVSTYHRSDLHTPHIDRLAAEGMLFTSMRANATVCSPSRAALLTGRDPDRVGVPGVIRTHPRDSWGYFDPTVPTLANELSQAGYHTALVGKWHLGLASPNTPNDRGFDHFHGFLGDMMDSYTHHLRHGQNYLRRNRETIEADGHATDLFTQWAINHLRDRSAVQEQPFFLLLSYNAPHFPIEPPAEWLQRVIKRQPDLDPRRARNIAFVEHLDANIGKVLNALRETGLEYNTVVAFTSDNGGSLAHAQNNHPWRDGKQSHYDGGLRVPFMVRWPGTIPPGSRSDYPGQVFDLFPTLLEIAGRPLPPNLDAVSLLPLWKGGSLPTDRDLYFVRREGGPRYGGKSYEALIRGPWKLLQNDPYSPLELYHLENDPQETRNLAHQEPERLRELATALRARIQRGGAIPWQPPVNDPR